MANQPNINQLANSLGNLNVSGSVVQNPAAVVPVVQSILGAKKNLATDFLDLSSKMVDGGTRSNYDANTLKQMEIMSKQLEEVLGEYCLYRVECTICGPLRFKYFMCMTDNFDAQKTQIKSQWARASDESTVGKHAASHMGMILPEIKVAILLGGLTKEKALQMKTDFNEESTL